VITAAFPVAVLRSVWREAPPLLTAIGGCPPSAKCVPSVRVTPSGSALNAAMKS
jgi:hypothetical protein